MASAHIVDRQVVSDTQLRLEVGFLGTDVLGGSVSAGTTATISTSDNPNQIMAAMATAVRALAASINKTGGGNGVTVPANQVLDLLSLNRG